MMTDKMMRPGPAFGPCRTCHGTKTVMAVVKAGNKPEPVPCPVCRGTGRAGLVTK